MISSTHALGMPSTVASSVRAALRAGMTTITLASPLPAGVAGQRGLVCLEHAERRSVSCAAHADLPASRDLQGLRRPRPLRRADRRRRRRGRRPRRSRACSPDLARQAGGRAARRPRARHAPAGARAGRRATATGMVAEGAHVLDAGMVGTEMLYFLVGSRDLDGGLMCTASHNPKAYTGAKLVERGAVALSGDRGHRRDRARCIEDGLGEAPGGGSLEEVDVYADFQRRGAEVHRPGARSRPLKVVLDGGNGMAGPMVGPLLERLGARPRRRPTGSPTASSPTTSPTRCCPRTASFIIDKVRDEGADLGIAWDGDADRCFFIDEHRRVRRRRLPHRAARRVDPARSSPGADILYDVRASRAVAGHGRGGRRHARSSTASATRSSRPACATRAARSAARSPATTTSATSTTPTPARSRRC